MLRLPPNATHPQSRAAWRRWLESHHTRAEGVWLVSDRKATGKPRVEYEESVEEALCFGRIDSKVKTARLASKNLWANQWRNEASPRSPHV